MLRNAQITVDRKRFVTITRMEIGVTHTQYGLDTGGDLQAIVRGKHLLSAAHCRLQNTHIMGWGMLNPNPAPGVYDWSTLDRRMSMIRSIPGSVPVITLCGCPDWMKGGRSGETDWNKLEVAPLPEHYDDFAALAAKVSQRYPYVRHFQVWNEMKGLWNAPENNWDYRAYTALYNEVYKALKAVDRANQVGGPYLVVEGTGSGKEPMSDATAAPLSKRNRSVIAFWLRNKHGADFLTLDRGLTDFHDANRYSMSEQMQLTRWFGAIQQQVRQLFDAHSLPLWWAEFYASSKGMTLSEKAVINASAFRSALLGGASVVLLWQPMDTDEVGHALFTDARMPGGGRPLPLYEVVRTFNTDFKPGTKIVASQSSAPQVEVLASQTRILVINKSAEPVRVSVNRQQTDIAGKAVRVLRY